MNDTPPTWDSGDEFAIVAVNTETARVWLPSELSVQQQKRILLALADIAERAQGIADCASELASILNDGGGKP